jgi:hypothetical protein
MTRNETGTQQVLELGGRWAEAELRAGRPAATGTKRR